MEWKDKTCRNCMYRDVQICRKFPPCILANNLDKPDDFPFVWVNDIYSLACSYYEETK